MIVNLKVAPELGPLRIVPDDGHGCSNCAMDDVCDRIGPTAELSDMVGPCGTEYFIYVRAGKDVSQ